jgi:hypothetical protein
MSSLEAKIAAIRAKLEEEERLLQSGLVNHELMSYVFMEFHSWWQMIFCTKSKGSHWHRP